jgi:hypothetical protein
VVVVGGVFDLDQAQRSTAFERVRRRAEVARRKGNPFIRSAYDIIYTRPDFAKRIIDYFQPTGFILNPCKGAGAFFDNFPTTEQTDWCEINEGRDFRDWTQLVDWAMTNPPWSAKLYRAIAQHCFEIAIHTVLLARLHNVIGTTARIRDFTSRGVGLREIIICRWEDAGFPNEGFPLAVFHWQRGWQDGTVWTDWT